MPGQITFALDDSEFQGVMAEYIRRSSKEAATAMNRTMNSLAIFGVTEAKEAQAGEIERVQTLDWWPKFVAAVMVRKKAKQLAVKMQKASAKGKTISGKSYTKLVALHYTREEARKESARIIRNRSLAIGFVRFFFVTLSRRVREYVPGARAAVGKSFRGFEVDVKPATVQDPSIRASVKYAYRSRGQKAVQKAEALLQDILDRARPLLIADMRKYIADKLNQIPKYRGGAA
jgi:hypothetical protein